MSINVTTTPSVCHHSSDEDEDDVRYLATTVSPAAATDESSLGFLDSISTSPADNHTVQHSSL